MKYETYHDILKEEFEHRNLINPAYSLRAFARDIGLSAPRLNQVLSKKHGLSVKAAKEVVSKLNLNLEQSSWFMDSVGALHARSFVERNKYVQKLENLKSIHMETSFLELEYFRVISDWYHFAILELTHLEDFESCPKWIGEVLGVDPQIISMAIERLLTLKLLVKENGIYRDNFEHLRTPNDIPSNSLRKFHTQLMKLALEALIDQDVLDREFSSSIMSIDKDFLPQYKEEIRQFRRNLNQKVNQHPKRNAVYCLGIQFFCVSKGEKNEIV